MRFMINKLVSMVKRVCCPWIVTGRSRLDGFKMDVLDLTPKIGRSDELNLFCRFVSK